MLQRFAERCMVDRLRVIDIRARNGFDPNAYVVFACDYDALAAELTECQKLRDSWCQEFTEQRDDANALVKRCAELETGIQLIGNELSLHADKGPAGEIFRSLLSPML
jgi:hypothetical protein